MSKKKSWKRQLSDQQLAALIRRAQKAKKTKDAGLDLLISTLYNPFANEETNFDRFVQDIKNEAVRRYLEENN